MRLVHAALVVTLILVPAEAGLRAARAKVAVRESARSLVLQRAHVWTRTNIRSMDLGRGPAGAGSFAPGETVRCDYRHQQLSGNSPKFACVIGADDEVKVKFGGNNGEVYAELLATRLLWALGFGADRMYRVNVICRGCPAEFGGIARPGGESRFSPALIERKMDGDEWDDDTVAGWAWPELDAVKPGLGGAPLEHRDALKLLAVMLQHTDNKAEQQRILCLGGLQADGVCQRPFLMISDVGLTFGRATWGNINETSAANLAAWQATPVWRNGRGCVGNLPKSFSGDLGYPIISEGGRRFLASLLVQLSDRQLTALFDAALVTHRLREPGHALSGFSTVQEWVTAFKDKRRQIVERRCI